MPGYTESTKQAIYKWRETHADVFDEYNRMYHLANRHKYSDKRRIYSANRYALKKEIKIFLNILLD
jgi:hypothetical protein